MAKAPRTSPKPRLRTRLSRRFWLVAGAVLVVFVLGLPMALRHALNAAARRWVSHRLSLDRLSFNPVTGRARLGISHSDSFGLEDHRVRWRWLPLLQRILRVPEVHLSGLRLHVQRFGDGTLQIEDIRYRPAEESLAGSLKSTKPPKPVVLEVGRTHLENVSLSFTDHASNLSLRLDLGRLTLEPDPAAPYASYTTTSRLERILEFSGRLRLEDLLLSLAPPAPGEPPEPLPLLKGASLRLTGAYDVSGLHVRILPRPGGGLEEWTIRLASASSAGPTRCEITSDQFHTPLRLVFDPVSFSLQGIDSASPDQEAAYALSAEPGEGGSIDVEGRGRPFRRPPSMTQALRLKSFPLPRVSPLAERLVQYRIESGRFSMDSRGAVGQGVVNVKNALTLEGLALDRLGAGEQDPLGRSLGLPLGTAVALLKDGKGVIRLDVPIRADMNAPGFTPNILLKKAVAQGVQSGVRAAITNAFPNLFRAGATGFRSQLGPVLYPPGLDTRLESDDSIMDHVGRMMSSRPGLVLTLKGVASARDVRAVRNTDGPQTAELPLNSLSEAEKAAVLALAARRAEGCRDHLTSRHRIDPARLTLSPPDYAPDDSEPRVLLGL